MFRLTSDFITVWNIASSPWELFKFCCQRRKLGVFFLCVFCTGMTVAAQTAVLTQPDDLEPSFVGTIQYSVPQQVQYEKLRLDFLKKCRLLKRPPQSLRVSGANALDDGVKLTLLSKLESEILEKAILQKTIFIERLSNRLRENPADYLNVEQNLPRRDKASISKHFQKKLNFYTTQKNTKWKAWPVKQANPTKKSRSTNYKKKHRKRRNFVQKLADKAVKQNVVIPLVDFDIPAGAIVLLSRGLGFVKTPNLDRLDIQLDMRSAGNNILNAADKIHLPTPTVAPSPSTIPSKLRNRTYHKNKPSTDPVVNSLVENMESDFTGVLRHKAAHVQKKKSNISKAEEDGFKWLKKNVNDKKIVICEADKGGAILIVPPSLIEEKVSEKLLDESLYTELSKDPSLQLFDELFDMWKHGREAGFISSREAYEVLGVTEPDTATGYLGGNKSTSSRYRPGIPYFYPMLKIHKLSRDQLKHGCNPPARLVTALNEGVCKRSDVFIAKNYLKDVEKLYCGDLLKDTNAALLWLENLNDRYSAARKRATSASPLTLRASMTH